MPGCLGAVPGLSSLRDPLLSCCWVSVGGKGKAVPPLPPGGGRERSFPIGQKSPVTPPTPGGARK